MNTLMAFRRIFFSYFTKESHKIMPSKRFFPNKFSDITSGEIQIPQEFLTQFIKSLNTNIERSIRPIEKNGRDGLYLGTAGIAYMYYHLSKTATLDDDFLAKALTYLKPALKAAESATSATDPPSFILGSGGVYALAAVLFQASGDPQNAYKYKALFHRAADICKEIDFLPSGSDELFVGRAGYILGALWLSKETKAPLKTEIIYNLCDVMIESGRSYSTKFKSSSPLMYSYHGVEYLGAAHGLSTILQALISVPNYMESRPEQAALVRASIDYLLSLQDRDGNFPCTVNEIGEVNELVHWCHGAGGIIFLMLKAYLLWNDEKYLNSCRKMADLMWRKGLLRKGPGICHGIAGNGYAFLVLYRATKESVYLHRAIVFAQFMKSEEFRKARVPDYPCSLYEGVAGTNCFLADLMAPERAEFPFLDVF